MAVLAAGVSSRALAQAVRRAGLAPVAVDCFGDRDLVATCPSYAVSPWSVARLVDQAAALGPFDGVMLAGGLEDAPDAVARLAACGPLWGNSPAVLRRVRDWPLVASVLGKCGVAVPEQLPAGAPCPADPGRWLLKPLRGGGGVGIRFAEPGAPAPPGYRLERYVAGTPGSVLFLAARGRAVALGATEQVTGMAILSAPGFQYAGNILRSDVALAGLQPICEGLAREFGLVGLNGVDFIWRDGAPVILEVNPRWTASMELWEQATGASLVAMHVAAVCRGELPERLPAWSGARGKAILYGERAGVWRFAGDWEAVGICDVPLMGAAVAPGRPVCTVLYHGASPSEVRAGLAEKARQVRREWLD